MELSDQAAHLQPHRGVHRIHVPPELIFSLAVGADDPYNTMTAYGMSDRMIEALQNDPAFQRTVEAKRNELKQSGYTFRLKAALGAEMLLDEVLTGALGEQVPLAVKHDILKTFSKLGNLEPKEDKQAVAPTGFTVNITLGGKTLSIGGEKPTVTVDLPAENEHCDVAFVESGGRDEPPEGVDFGGKTPPKYLQNLIYEPLDKE